VYDFGDHWRHGVLVEKALPTTSEKLPVCLAGRRACPPEDVGGHGVTPSSWRHTTIRRTKSINSSANGPEMDSMRRPSTPEGDRKLRGLRLR